MLKFQKVKVMLTGDGSGNDTEAVTLNGLLREIEVEGTNGDSDSVTFSFTLLTTGGVDALDGAGASITTGAAGVFIRDLGDPICMGDYNVTASGLGSGGVVVMHFCLIGNTEQATVTTTDT